MRNEKELAVMMSGLLIFTSIYLGFIGIVLTPTLFNQYNLGTKIDYSLGTNTSPVTFIGSANATMSTVLVNSYGAFGLTTVLPIIIFSAFLLMIISGYMSWRKLKGVKH